MAIEQDGVTSTPPAVTPLRVNPGTPSTPPATIPAVAASSTQLPLVPSLDVSSGVMSASDVAAQAAAVRLAATQSPAGTVPTLVDGNAKLPDIPAVQIGGPDQR